MKERSIGIILAVVGLIGLLLLLSLRIGKPCLEYLLPLRVAICYGGLTTDGNEPVTTLDIDVMEKNFVVYTAIISVVLGIGVGLILTSYLSKYKVVEKKRRV